MNVKRFTNLVWGLLIYSFPVFAFGAFVRASNSGDGCGNHWPDCNGTFNPFDGNAKHIIEFTHRGSTVIYGLLALALYFFSLRLFPKRSPVRYAATFTLLFTVFEALIGRALVKGGYVGNDDSIARAVWMSIHLINTFLLLGSITLTGLWSCGVKKLQLKGQNAAGWAIAFGALGLLILGISGAVTALGDTLFPAQDLLAGIRQDLSPTAHFLVKLRVLHPLIAMSVGVYLVLMGGLLTHLRPSSAVKKGSQWLTTIFLSQLVVGVVNLLFRAPIGMQLFHLFAADVLWVAFVWTATQALAQDVTRTEVVPADEDNPVLTTKQLLKQYVSLTKPRVISLLLFTTMTSMFIAAGGWPGLGVFLAVAVGGYMSAGSANAINMVIDRDIDGTMKRTSKRPTVTQSITSANALMFGLVLGAASFVILWVGSNLLTAMLSLAGLAFYVVIYTLLLKRRTWHNIVIGGAAGAFPPLVGWASVTDNLTPLAWILFGIIFVWTPVHFWALALLIKDDYAGAGVPMLPVVHGERATVIQISLYAVLTAVVSLLPMLQPGVSYAYFVIAILLNCVLFVRCAQLFKTIDRPRAVSLYKYSMLYLFILFLVLAVDRSISL